MSRRFASRHTRGLREIRPLVLKALACASVVMALTPALAGATFPGRNGRIAFVDAFCSVQPSPCDEPDGMYFVNPRSGGVRLVAAVDYTDPAFSPGGRRLALSDNRSRIGIASVGKILTGPRPRGDDLETVAPRIERWCRRCGRDRMPRWSADGQQIMFLHDGGPNDSWATALTEASARGQARRRLAVFEDDVAFDLSTRGEVAVSPFSPEQHGLSLISTDGAPAQVLTTGYDEWPSWSPRGDKLVFARAHAVFAECGKLFTINRDGTDLRRLSTPRCASHPVWSPDGRLVAYTGRYGDVFVIDAGGGPPRRVARSLGTRQLDWQPLR